MVVKGFSGRMMMATVKGQGVGSVRRERGLGPIRVNHSGQCYLIFHKS